MRMFHLKPRIHVEKSASTGLSTPAKVAIGVGGTVLGVAGGVAAASSILPVVGFTAGGVAAGSLAASWQASIGNVVVGSLFSALQSAGAAGLGQAGIGVATAAGATVGGIAGGIAAAAEFVYSGVKKNIPVEDLLKTFDIYDSDQDGYVLAERLQNILKDLEINMSDTELGKNFKKATGCDFNMSTPISYEEFLALFDLRIFKGSELQYILENLFVKVVKEKGRVSSDDVKEMFPVLNVNASEKHIQACFESVLGGESGNFINLNQFLKIFGVSETKSKL